MKKNILTIISLFISQLIFSQDYYTEFKKYFKDKDTINQLITLEKWEVKSPNDAELFTSYFNYYFVKSKKEIISLSGEKTNKEGFVINDSLNKPVGFISGETYFNSIDLKKGYDKIDLGINLYSNRLVGRKFLTDETN